MDRLREMEVPKRYVPDQDACIDAHLDAYLNNPSVQKSLHVRATTWNHCGGPQYDYYMGSIVPVYEDLMNYSHYKILVYAGDQDCVINFLSTEAWIFKMNRPVTSAWKPWMYRRSEHSGTQVAGWGTSFDRISFRTVKGAGHMVCSNTLYINDVLPQSYFTDSIRCLGPLVATGARSSAPH